VVRRKRVSAPGRPRFSCRNVSSTVSVTIVYGMLQAGLVELIKPEGFQPKSRFQARPEAKADARETAGMKRSVVERLISRIKRI
jgi:hypothetical protein